MSTDISIEDSIYTPLPGANIKGIRPISTTNLIESYGASVRGCNNSCPCRRWTNCSYYNKMKWKKSRRDDDEHMKTVWEYYNSIFRITYDIPIVNMNG